MTFRRIPLEDSYLLTCDQDELVLLKIACFQHNWLVGSLTVIIRTPTEFDVDIHTTNNCSDEVVINWPGQIFSHQLVQDIVVS